MIEGDLFKSLFDVIPFDIYVVDVKNHEIIYMNKKMIEGRGNFIGSRCHEFIYGETKPCYFCKIPQLLDPEGGRPMDKTVVFELFNPVNDRWYQLQEKAMTWPDGRITKYSIAVDISELKETQNRLAEAHAELALKNRTLQRLSTTDALTDLLNRMKIEELVEESVYAHSRYGRTFSVILIDIDHFKDVNDTYGHPTGDEVLRRLSGILKSQIRKTDAAGRWGGEEFLILCRDTDQESAAVLAEKLRETVQAQGAEPGVTISLGVAGYLEGEDRVDLIRRADAALYRAKQAGRNRTAPAGS